MNVLGVIPARAGSKRIPNKNIALLCGRPLLTYTCQAAVESGVCSKVYINTDSPRIAAVARQYGVECPVLRPEALARDDTPGPLATRFLLAWLVERGEKYDAVVLLQPTSPLRSADDVRAAVSVYEMHAPCSVVSVTRVAPSSWLGRVGKDGRFERLPGEDPVYRLNGAIYVYDFEDCLHDRTPARTIVYPMPADRGVDIDTIDDWRYAELTMRSVPAMQGVA